LREIAYQFSNEVEKLIKKIEKETDVISVKKHAFALIQLLATAHRDVS
jgi:hypothetical protein